MTKSAYGSVTENCKKFWTFLWSLFFFFCEIMDNVLASNRYFEIKPDGNFRGEMCL